MTRKGHRRGQSRLVSGTATQLGRAGGRGWVCVTGVACVRVQGRGPGPGLGLGAYYYPDPADVLGWIPGIADVVEQHVIVLSTELPRIEAKNVVIDGWSQPADTLAPSGKAGVPRIRLDGTAVPG